MGIQAIYLALKRIEIYQVVSYTKMYQMVKNPISSSCVREVNILSMLFSVTNHTNQTFVTFNSVDDTLQHKTQNNFINVFTYLKN